MTTPLDRLTAYYTNENTLYPVRPPHARQLATKALADMEAAGLVVTAPVERSVRVVLGRATYV